MSKADFKVFVDFDSTLFDTKRFSTNWWQEVSRLSGVSTHRIIEETALFHAPRTWQPYNFIGHMRSYGLDLDVLWLQIESMIQKTDYLYPDSAWFIQKLFAAGFTPEILSFGEVHFQQVKIKAAIPRLMGKLGAETPLAHQIVGRRKRDHISEHFPGGHGVLVDDVADQELPTGFVEVHLDRTKPLKAPIEKPTGYTVSNLKLAFEVIEEVANKK